MELQTEWNEFLVLLSRHGVRYVLVGGLAVAVHGHERYTKDLDVFTSEDNARRLGRALVEYGLKAQGRAWCRFTEPYRILTIGREPLRIDVLTGISGVSFEAVWRGHIEVSTSVGSIPTIGIAELRANKLASGRPEDLADIAKLDQLAAIRAADRNPSRRRCAAASSRRKPGTRRR